MISILIADDHKLIRETWTYILNNDVRFKVVASCENAEDAIKLTRQKHPDVILMDINMTPFSGMEATRRIREVWPQSRIIGVTMHSQPSYARKMLQIGASGYVTKNSSREEMMEAIVKVHEGNKYICSEIKDIMSDQAERKPMALAAINSVTEREMEIINLIKKGHSSKEISNALQISLKTVEVHRHNILKKLKLKNSASLVNFMNTRSTYI
ncbi:MAG: response regulator transcription factor [Bacteroidota bacterium]|nr:response regulator transcription factor [Bacteroidota bacterium]MDP4212507.1 response regulator transcription factor [Bacteroidota bacterium]MDP4248916.1 response regulator transcription factor [Bacteroidota bacterium]